MTDQRPQTHDTQAHLFRKLTVFDAAAAKDHFLRLDPESRYLRFMGGMSEQALAKYAKSTPSLGHYAIGCFIDGKLRALGELVLPHWPLPTSAEVAFSIEGPFQGRGIGAELMDRLLTLAVNRGVRRVHVSCLHDNARMRHIVEKFNGRLIHETGGEIDAEISAGWPTYWTLLAETMRDARAAAQSTLRLLAA